jgi:hypothetical protein
MLKTMLLRIPRRPKLDAVTVLMDELRPIGVPEITPVDALIVTPLVAGWSLRMKWAGLR